MIHSFLLVGQSNMAGRGYPADVEPILNKDIVMMRNGRWQPMHVPVNPDRITAGINLAESFADLYAREKNVTVGLIPCADGGTNIDQWQVGGLLFDHACYMAELASRTSTIAGILWHQGESDAREDLYEAYEGKLTVVLEGFRKRLNLYDVPIILGGLSDCLLKSDRAWKFVHYQDINASLMRIAEKQNMVGFVPVDGLESNPYPDCVHFSAKSLRELGRRYYYEFLKHEDKNKVFTEKSTPDSAIRTDLESL